MSKNDINNPKIVSRAEWLIARKELLTKEKDATRLRDLLNTERRKLPMVKLAQEYIFEGPQGPTNLRDLFDGRRQLIVYHFMFDPSWDEGCKSCSHFMDNVDGALVHLAARDTSFAVVSLAPYSKIAPFKARMGWTCQWLSSFGSDFNYDFHVTLDEARGSAEYLYNYASAKTLLAAGKIWFAKGELPGMSVFLQEGNDVFHTYSTYQRGLDLWLNTYNLLDATPLGRNEEDSPGQSWIRHHDKYRS